MTTVNLAALLAAATALLTAIAASIVWAGTEIYSQYLWSRDLWRNPTMLTELLDKLPTITNGSVLEVIKGIWLNLYHPNLALAHSISSTITCYAFFACILIFTIIIPLLARSNREAELHEHLLPQDHEQSA